MTGSRTEAELDAFRDEMGLDELMPRITAPTLLTVGQYDPRSPVDEVFGLYDSMTAPRELWVFENQHHNTNMKANFSVQWLGDHHSTSADWLAARLRGLPVEQSGGTRWLAPGGAGPHDSGVRDKRAWFE